MGFFGKKREANSNEWGEIPELPELPKLPPLPKLPEDEFSIKSNDEKNHPLPSFPNSSLGERINQDAIKEAVNTIQSKNSERRGDIPPVPNAPNIVGKRGDMKPRTMEIGDWNKPEWNRPPTMSLMPQQMPSIEPEFPKRAEPLFIRLDTFEKAISNFNEIKLRVSEIEALVRNIKDIKAKEEREIIDWEREIETVKIRLSEIERDIFSKM